MIRIAHVERHGPNLGTTVRVNPPVRQPLAVGEERVWIYEILSVQQALDLSRAVSANPAESGAAGVEPENDVLAVRAPCRLGGLNADLEARHPIPLQVIDEGVPIGAFTFHQCQLPSVGREVGLQVETWRGDQ